MDKYKKLATNTIIFAIGTFSSKILSFLLMPFVTSKLVTSDYSTADLIQQTANVLIPIVFLQINSAALRFALDKQADKSDVFTVGVRTTLKGFLVFLIFYYPVTLININDMPLGQYAPLIYLFVLVSGMRQLCQQFVRGCGQVRVFAIDGIVATGTTLLFNLLFLGPLNMGVNGYVLAIIASDLFSVLFLFVATRLWNNLHFHKVDKKIKHDMLKYSVPLMPTIILWWIINVSDRYMVTGFVGSAENGLYTAASKIPNFVIMFSSIFIDAWQLSAVDEYDSDDKAEFFTKIFRIYSGGIFAVSSALILACQLITKILVADSYYESWRYVPVLIIATTLSCLVNFLASVYMAEKKSVMAMVTALSGALTNIVLNLVLIPLIGALGAAIATIAAFAVVFVFRGSNTRKYIKIKFNAPLIAVEVAILAAQCVVMLWLKSGIYMYLAEAALFGAMLLVNIKPIKELS
ncbi:lipopolysaccharide biosynthesis protein, partial [Eubacterium sp.]|uniref:lipopolysaccharide biosynthesis protein n=1 Tax=Eubacterium sp. TaxID=142586 RepID=UPI003F02BF7D